MKKIIALALVAAMAAMTMVACGGEAEETTAEDTTVEDTTAEDTTAEDTTAEEAAE